MGQQTAKVYLFQVLMALIFWLTVMAWIGGIYVVIVVALIVVKVFDGIVSRRTFKLQQEATGARIKQLVYEARLAPHPTPEAGGTAE